ncbi:TadE/TadG family type IV pilus assembly protein [Neomicrococcus lactis]
MKIQAPRSFFAKRADRHLAIRDEEGSSIPEFVMVSTLIIALFISILQLTLVLHVRNVMLDAAATGARYGTLADRNASDGSQRTRELLSTSLGSGFAANIGAQETSVGGQPGLQIHISAGFPLLGFFSVGGEISVVGEAVRYE